MNIDVNPDTISAISKEIEKIWDDGKISLQDIPQINSLIAKVIKLLRVAK